MVEYRRFCVVDVSTDTIYQTDNEKDAHDIAAQCPFGEVAFFELPDEDTFDVFWANVIQTGEYDKFTI